MTTEKIENIPIKQIGTEIYKRDGVAAHEIIGNFLHCRIRVGNTTCASSLPITPRTNIKKLIILTLRDACQKMVEVKKMENKRELEKLLYRYKMLLPACPYPFETSVVASDQKSAIKKGVFNAKCCGIKAWGKPIEIEKTSYANS